MSETHGYHPRWSGKDNKFSDPDPRARGWYSRRHQDGELARRAHDSREAAVEAKHQRERDRDEAAKGRSPQDQLRRLDARNGRGLGAARERARLLAKI